MFHIAVLITCFNRKEKTLACLKQIFDSEIDHGSLLDVYLVDDGSSDGTGDAVRKEFPEVRVIDGNGCLFWNGGMRLAWEEASKAASHDFYLWVNDDIVLFKDSIKRIIQTHDHLKEKGEVVGTVVGTMRASDEQKPTYGGRRRCRMLDPTYFGDVIEPLTEPLMCDVVNGNFTLIPKSAFEKIGNLSSEYTHGMGDFDYGLRLSKRGYTSWVAPGYFGYCDLNPKQGGCKDKELSISDAVKVMGEVGQLPPVDEWNKFVRKHGGIFWPLLVLKSKARAIFPALWVVFRRHSL